MMIALLLEGSPNKVLIVPSPFPPSLPPRCSEERVSNPKPRRRRGSKSLLTIPTCARCVKRHEDRCLGGTEGCYGCGDNGYKMRYCPVLRARGRERNQLESYFLQAKNDQVWPPYVTIDMYFKPYLHSSVSCLLWLDRFDMIDFEVVLSMNDI